jgi:hypothetical protein
MRWAVLARLTSLMVAQAWAAGASSAPMPVPPSAEHAAPARTAAQARTAAMLTRLMS